MTGLEFIRRHRNETLQNVADFLGISKQALSNWENGRRGISPEYAEKLSDYLCIPQEYLTKEVSDLDMKKIINYYNTVHGPYRHTDSPEYCSMISEITDLSNQIDDVFFEKYCAPDQALNLKEMRKCLDFISRMIARIRKGDFDD